MTTTSTSVSSRATRLSCTELRLQVHQPVRCTFDDAMVKGVFTTDIAQYLKVAGFRASIYTKQFPTGTWLEMKGLALPESYHRLVPTELRIQPLSPGLALATFHLRNAERLARRTVLLHREGADWRILHLHASNVPVDRRRGPRSHSAVLPSCLISTAFSSTRPSASSASGPGGLLTTSLIRHKSSRWPTDVARSKPCSS